MSVIEREGFCPTCGQHHLAESDTEELHALLGECKRLEREVLKENERLRQQLAGAVAENQKLRDRVADLEKALEHYADTSATDPWMARDALTNPGGQ